MNRREFLSSGAAALAAACALPAPSNEDGQMGPRRIVEVHRGNGWQRCAFEDLRKGDVFRLFEPDGERVRDGSSDAWIATSDPKKVFDRSWLLRGKWTWGIESESVPAIKASWPLPAGDGR